MFIRVKLIDRLIDPYPVFVPHSYSQTRGLKKNTHRSALILPANIHPTLHTSTGVEYFLDPINTSGARYQSVTTSWVYDRTGIPKARASPKSPNFRYPS